jgi:hypothetical protein
VAVLSKTQSAKPHCAVQGQLGLDVKAMAKRL